MLSDRDAQPGRIPWLELGLEMLLVVVSVLLALGLNSWRQARADEVLAQRALRGLRAEMRVDRKRVRDALVYHRALLDSLHAHPDHPVALRPAFLELGAWESAQASGAAAHLPYRVTAAVTRVYSMERRYDDVTSGVLQGLYADLMRGSASDHRTTQLLRWQPELQDLGSLEAMLGKLYEQALEAMGEEANAGGPPKRVP